jgi:hypothetical protein
MGMANLLRCRVRGGAWPSKAPNVAQKKPILAQPGQFRDHERRADAAGKR